jgi:indolepyruvate ferredoxin oxidoreductase
MAYKDEYEVARLYADPAFFEKLRGQFEGDLALQFHLAPPLFARRDPATGHLRKRAYGPWMLPAMRVLARMKRLRGTSLDVFGRTDERRAERRDIVDFEKVLAHLAADVDAGNYALAVEIATQPLALRGFGHVKARNRVPYAAKLATLLARFRREETIAQAAD